MSSHFFTVDEARALLPTIKEWLGQTMLISKKLRGFSGELEKLSRLASENAGSEAGTAYVELLTLMQEYMSKIRGAGCLVKSVEEGLIDFPHLRDGREVYLCWRYGEDEIDYWHEIDAGFAGRLPIENED